MTSAASQYDLAIIGGGMVGASLALALQDTPCKILLVEGFAPNNDSQPSFDDRTTALGNGSRQIFESLGIWSGIAPLAGAIHEIHISDAGRFGFARLRAAEQGVEAFGYVVSNRVIGRVLWDRLAAQRNLTCRMPARAQLCSVDAQFAHLTIDDEPCMARLVVAADGAQSAVRAALGIEAGVEDYDQVAIVANFSTNRAHLHIAYERFTPSGAIAALPLADGSMGAVWTLAPPEAQRVQALSDAEFMAQWQRALGWRAGAVQRVGKRASYPLKLMRAVSTTAPRAVLIGNAAQALHPVAGQGFNLGLRDAATLAELIAGAAAGSTDASVTASSVDIGAPQLLARFAARRNNDRTGITRFTDGLIKLFGDTRPGIGAARDLGLLLFDLAPPAKRALSRISWGLGREGPRLLRGLPLA